MLNPPLSLVSDELLAFIVEHLAALPYSHEAICNLSLADSAFTQFCQNVLFRTLKLGSYSVSKSYIPYQLEKFQNILNEKPSAANRVRFVRLIVLEKQNEWIFNDPTFIRILELLAESPCPPHRLRLGGASSFTTTIGNPIFVVGLLAQSFFSQTLTTLDLEGWENVQLPLLLICPKLRVVTLNNVDVTDNSYDGYQDDQCARESPSLEVFKYRYSHSLVRQMIIPPPRFQAPVILWSKLRILTLCPYVKEDMACLQPILDAACNSLEELHLSTLRAFAKQIPLARLVNLTNLSNLHVFSLIARIEGSSRKSSVLQDINTILSRIPSNNNITNLFFDFTISGRRPFRACVDEDWAGLCQQIIRIAARKPLELDFQMGVDNNDLEEANGEGLLYTAIMQKVASLPDCPNICTHFWDPTYWGRDLKPFPLGEVRTKCKR